MDIRFEIGNRIKLVRGKLSQQAFSKKLNVGQTTIGRYERGERSPYAEFLLLLKEHFDISPNWLISGDGQMFITGQEPQTTPTATSKKENVIVIKHQDLVSRFKDPEKGIENNVHLLTIEDASEQLYKKVSEYLKTTSEAAKIIKSEMEDQKKRNKTGWQGSDGENASSA